MVRFLSRAWFERAGAHSGIAVPPDALVLRQVVTGTPEGEVRYDVVVADGRARLDTSLDAVADITFMSDYATAAEVSAGRLTSADALAAGRLRVRGDVRILSERNAEVTGVDALPAGLREDTDYPPTPDPQQTAPSRQADLAPTDAPT